MLYNSDMLDFQKKAEELVFSEEKAWKENVFKPIIKNNKDKWKVGLTTLQASIVELVLRKQFEKLGYKRQTNLSVFSYIYMVYVDLLSLVFKLKRRKESIQ